MYLQKQKFLVFGISKSGISAIKTLLLNGAECYFYEELDSDKIREASKTLEELGAIKVTESVLEEILQKIDVLLLSPGVPINHSIPIKARRLNKRIIGEFELGALLIKTPIIAVTGTNGKTTTSTMISQILSEDKISNQLVGNIGVPITKKITEINNSTLAVAEISSFQLETVHSFTPHVACFLNIAPDHLERHYTMENYIFLKKRLLKNMRESEYAVLNKDNKEISAFQSETKARIIWVSLKEKVDGVYRQDGYIYYFNEVVMKEDDLLLKGEHNIEDAFFAIAATKAVGVSNEAINKALTNFKGIRHRIEFIKEINGVNYYNDSKATNTNSTISALDTMKRPTVLILGGKDKGEDFAPLFEKLKISTVTHAILIGEVRYKLLDEAVKCGFDNVTVTNDFETSVKIASMLAQSGDNVLLSPACSSFDMFESFEERGERFCKIVEEF